MSDRLIRFRENACLISLVMLLVGVAFMFFTLLITYHPIISLIGASLTALSMVVILIDLHIRYDLKL